MEKWEDGTPKSTGVWDWRTKPQVEEEIEEVVEEPKVEVKRVAQEQELQPVMMKDYNALHCPNCGTPSHRVLETRTYSNLVKVRRKECTEGHRWTTVEVNGKEFMNRRSKPRSRFMVGGYK